MRTTALPVILVWLCATVPALGQIDTTSRVTDTSEKHVKTPPPAVVRDTTIRPGAPVRRAPYRYGISETVLSADSLLRLEYHDAEDVLAGAGVRQFGLGNFVAPKWAGQAGSLPFNYVLSEDGITSNDPFTGAGNGFLPHPETAERVIVRPMHAAFWYGGNGSLVVADFRDRYFQSPHPFSQIRHGEGPYGMLYTNVLFNQDVGRDGNLNFSLTRHTVGYTSADNSARFPNERSEDWNIDIAARWQATDRLTVQLRDRYFDMTSLEYGGVAGWRSEGGIITYPGAGTAFSDTAFSGILATLLNPTMKLKTTMNTVSAAADMDWTGDGREVSRVRLGYTGTRRNFSDGLSRGIPGETYGALDDDLRWGLVDLRVNHVSELAPLRLEVAADASRFSLDAPRPAIKDAAFLGMLAGRLSIDVASTSLAVFTRADARFDQNALGAGFTIEDSSLAHVALWTGGSYSSRPYTYFEKVSAERDYQATIVGAPDARMERQAIIEAGARWRSAWNETDLHVSYRTARIYRTISTTLERDTLPARFAVRIDYGERLQDVFTVDVASRFRHGLLGIDVTGAFNSFRNSALALTPAVQASVSVFFIGNLVSGALDLKGGVTAAWCSDYIPAWYNPRVGVFGTPPAGIPNATDARPYTKALTLDLFLYATIRHNATIHFLLDNLLDTRYITSEFYPMSERGIRFGVTWAFLD